ncbi:hypothetical protein NEOLEDRAFT_1088599 [Neolentinus lepideus HHB14362 ss-1]|uniref:Dbl homology domain-containing protein n=1 Tax=Neolentinus lepideus HHB14362 ss-1 TaxID=1314782 RepID=A0A165U4U4_9AGAM|nr:hypothetical protein NEOLEDRAFT_1088599 [Neolentinus lepideus HHB14362 ss-1]
MTMTIASAPPSIVSFPSTEPSSPYSHPPSSYLHRPPHLPFRRISLPTSPSILNRQSVASLASFDSLPEEQAAPGASMPVVAKNAVKKSKSRPTSLEVQRKSRKKDKDKGLEEAKQAKRRKIIHEFYETERSYVDGLDLIYAHFLTPIIESLETSSPLLDRAELTSIFSNFIDIWNLHRAFFSSLSTYLNNSQDATSPPPISPILLSHFPYLSMYTPFITSFSTAIASLNSLLYIKPAFAAFVAQQEAHERCGRLKLRDWLLTIVQRCPRYLLLLKDLIGCTDEEDPESDSLTAVHTLVSKITVSLNASLHTHAQTLALLALQRSTPNLPPNFQLITPGRTFLKRAPLLQLDSSTHKEREFLLFSDVLVWLASAERGDAVDDWDWGFPRPSSSKSAMTRPRILRTRSKSEAELPTLKSTPNLSSSPGSALPMSPSRKKVVRYASSGMEEKWVYKGHVDLVDLDVVVSPGMETGDERRFEVLSPEASFAVYASTEDERDGWAAAIRNAKASLLVSLNVMHPNSTLTSSSSTQHLRRALQALPHLPEDDHRRPRRGKVEHFVPAIWIPDGKTESCMRCGRVFGWRRRRHHCRLCGRCVCAGCSGSTFFISDPNARDSNKPARACDACYETVFPILQDGSSPTDAMPPAQAIGTLSNFPSWQSISMPSLALPGVGARASALMAIDLGSPKRPLEAVAEGESGVVTLDDGSEVVVPPLSRMRAKTPNRPKSYVQILEEFQEQEQEQEQSSSPSSAAHGPGDSTVSLGEMADDRASSVPVSPRKEDTARRHKRFSLPMVALQTTAVTARPTEDPKSKRFSLMLNGRSSNLHGQHGQAHSAHQHHVHGKDAALSSGAAAVKLNELLGKARAS